MIEDHLTIETNEGDMSTFVVRPESDGPFPVILFLMDAPGKREELHDMARRVAATGYYVMLPNLYYRDVPSFTIHREDPVSAKYMAQLMDNLSNAMVSRDASSLLEHAASDSSANTDAVGVTGYCMSGPFALWLAADFPEKVKAAASIHGVRLATDAEDSPHKRAGEIDGEILVLAAEFDDWVDRPHFDRLTGALTDAGVSHCAEWIEDVHHGFVFSQRPKYDKVASERHWELLHSLFDRNLKSPA
ncbi:MAG TPA: hydrolase [Acidimicrobiaceae bacterium]|nr:hydrolase [Acidimicrobiaceae bacterium]HAX04555.1 hydrolase [Acidimicrobiaceae bacterium]|tara:strand:+ start:186 stop:923 length:738 start_codon:yes stop_codon:yes gene_type:complete